MATAKSTTNEGASAKQTKPKKKPGRKSTKVKLPEGLIPIEEETWLLAPLTLTLMRHNYTSVQNKVLMSILECLQNILRQMLNAPPSSAVRLPTRKVACRSISIFAVSASTATTTMNSAVP